MSPTPLKEHPGWKRERLLISDAGGSDPEEARVLGLSPNQKYVLLRIFKPATPDYHDVWEALEDTYVVDTLGDIHPVQLKFTSKEKK